MPKYRRLPEDIEAIEFHGPITLEENGLYFRENLDGFQIWNDLHKSWINVSIGDMIRIDHAPEDVYPIKRDVFNVTYELIEK